MKSWNRRRKQELYDQGRRVKPASTDWSSVWEPAGRVAGTRRAAERSGPSAHADLLYMGLASVLNQILLAHSDDSAERARAVLLMSAISDGAVTQRGAREILDAAGTHYPLPTHVLPDVDLETRLTFLRLAIDVALVDGTVTAHELELLEMLERGLLLPASTARKLLGVVTGEDSSEARENYRRACRVLGVEPGADISVIRAAHRSLIRQQHPDLRPEHERPEATRRTSEINAAYDLLIGAA